jgi:hypothetical protein
MRKLLMLSFWGAILLLSGAPLAAQNSVDVLGGGPQPANTVGCAVLPNCIPAVWSTTSNAGTDISAPIAANFVFASNGGALPTDFPTATRGQICLADTRDLSGTTLFAQIAANCQAAGGVALLLIRDSAVTAPSAIPVFVIFTMAGTPTHNRSPRLAIRASVYPYLSLSSTGGILIDLPSVHKIVAAAR